MSTQTHSTMTRSQTAPQRYKIVVLTSEGQILSEHFEPYHGDAVGTAEYILDTNPAAVLCRISPEK